MAKTGGLGDNFYVGGYDLSGDVASVDQISGGPALLDVTAINKSANERIGGLRTGDMQFTAYHNSSAGSVSTHHALSALPTSDIVVTYARGGVLGNPGACINAKQVNYDPTRGTDGALTYKVDCQANGYGLEWGQQLTAGLVAATGGTASTHQAAISYAGTTSSFGAQAYLQVTALSGSAATVIVEHSTDGTAFTTLASFNAVSAAPAFQRTATGATTVNQYLRATSTQGGSTSSVTFNVVAVRNTTAVTF